MVATVFWCASLFSMAIALVCSAKGEIASYHYGIDIQNPEGADVKASDSGTIISVTPYKRGENQVTISHRDGSESVYVYVKPTVVVGQRVSSGDVIGVTNTSGFSIRNQIHYGFRSAPGTMFIDPESRLPQRGDAQ